MRAVPFVLLSLLLATASADAQRLTAIESCSGPLGPCQTTTYGLGTSALDGSQSVNRTPGDPSGFCSPELSISPVPLHGLVQLREFENCDPANQRCPVEIPTDTGQASGWLASSRESIPLGIAGTLHMSVDVGVLLGGNLGVRQLHGRCENSDVRCGRDEDCASGELCLSRCFESDLPCRHDSDCESGDACQTEIDWDGLGRCVRPNPGNAFQPVLCESDSECAADEHCLLRACTPERETLCGVGFGECESGLRCLDGLQLGFEGCVCCDHSLNLLCDSIPLLEYPEDPDAETKVTCPPSQTLVGVWRNAGMWVAEGGAGTAFTQEVVTLAAQREGVCSFDRHLGCGVRGDAAYGGCPDRGTCEISGFSCQRDRDCGSGRCQNIAPQACDLRENGYRIDAAALFPDGSPNPAICSVNGNRLVGVPNRDCATRKQLGVAADPLPGCLLLNFGIESRPDLDCNFVDDTEQGPDATGDLCPFLAEADAFADLNRDGVGDECQCGDANASGTYESGDLFEQFRCLVTAPLPVAGTDCFARVLNADTNGTGRYESADLFSTFRSLKALDRSGAGLLCLSGCLAQTRYAAASPGPVAAECILP